MIDDNTDVLTQRWRLHRSPHALEIQTAKGDRLYCRHHAPTTKQTNINIATHVVELHNAWLAKQPQQRSLDDVAHPA